MIDPKELRIGNFLLYNGRHRNANKGVIIEVEDIYEGCDSINHDSVALRNCEGIPLTPEILESCGFEKDTRSVWGGWVSPEYNDERFRVRKDEFSFYYAPHESATPVRLQYLHQLQNLFFILTSGTELTVNLDKVKV